jgi:hypothetical protein
MAAADGVGVQVVFAWGAGEDGQLGLEEAPSNLDEWHVATPTARPRARRCRHGVCLVSAALLRVCPVARAASRGAAAVHTRAANTPAEPLRSLPSTPLARRSLCPNCRRRPHGPPRRAAPQVVPAFASLPLRADAASAAPPLVGGSRQSLAVTADGALYTWGWNQKSSLGLGHQDAAKTPCQVTALAGVRVRQARARPCRL